MDSKEKAERSEDREKSRKAIEERYEEICFSSFSKNTSKNDDKKHIIHY